MLTLKRRRLSRTVLFLVADCLVSRISSIPQWTILIKKNEMNHKNQWYKMAIQDQ